MPGDDSGGEEETDVKKGIPAHITADNDGSMEADALSSQSADSNPQEKSDLGVRQGLVQNSMRTFEKKKKPAVAAAAAAIAEAPAPVSESDAKISADRKDRWAALLGKRPATKDGDSMSAWLMEVLAVSDLDTPLKTMSGNPILGFETVAVPPPARVEATKQPAVESPAHAAPAPPPEKKAAVVAAAAAAASPFKGGVVKKKRAAAEALKKDTAKAPASDSLVTGSFAEWKERKKQKKQAKMNPTQEAEV